MILISRDISREAWLFNSNHATTLQIMLRLLVTFIQTCSLIVEKDKAHFRYPLKSFYVIVDPYIIFMYISVN